PDERDRNRSRRHPGDRTRTGRSGSPKRTSAYRRSDRAQRRADSRPAEQHSWRRRQRSPPPRHPTYRCSDLNNGTSGVWEGDFVDGGATSAVLPAGSLHAFAPGQTFDTLTYASDYPIDLFWSDPLGASANDYDLFRLD